MLDGRKKIALLVTLITLFVFQTKVLVKACSSEEECNKLIQEYQSQVTRLQSQANTLNNQIAQFDAQIRLTTLKITQTEEKIKMLGGRIDQLESSIDSLEKAFSSRAVETYKLAKFDSNFIYVLTSPNLEDTVSRYHYLQKIQEADRDLFNRLTEAQANYTIEKFDQEDLQEELNKQKLNLNSQKAAKAQLLSATRNDEKRYQQLLTQAKAQLSALRRFVVSQGGASILSNQTKCDSWGCYYNQRDSQWGNIGMGGSSYSMAEYGCLVTSISMLASHYGKNIKPNDIAVNPIFFVPGTGYLYHSAPGMPFTITTASKSILDSELSAGRPVIAGLYGGPDHFIVILRKEGSNYIMHDPFLENGSNRPLTDKYSVGDISTLRIINFN